MQADTSDAGDESDRRIQGRAVRAALATFALSPNLLKLSIAEESIARLRQKCLLAANKKCAFNDFLYLRDKIAVRGGQFVRETEMHTPTKIPRDRRSDRMNRMDKVMTNDELM